ncbi:MoaA/NifB/PqqE/SkfB family radical SAM enzyme [Parabacteroides sp. PF5-5]|uniref:radical SAM protein n=1 Tax=unclassified Parabacteroides TaxID=2649774 RepID=UPI0024755440|nr:MULTISPECIES: radical SAM protein [unclassified Parabacteroides]MDH6305821.1 MoaA/NifB/PqqE/SkfB family radical SAM enzyme [Parabacteroides sp. PH5-39]MDH6317365.1 MoaA/NifB/PqqE/SkfB family radical SAM enzyme [Parabacteroides sp. PF5-13]MDH6320573.1 MoaA/NifB/PqqE/SkfB family radical SAM enzyme [Parabacteroides sp. PH5-13]MDH6324264.1 MoaA/NifB/PqqE/SkfB family radical SAM enzyme [Parabacteroides sp. PH5-8]MDH6328461.1 MoaA/NifB/PqqE/SkfB family radical SAM enzyme [Parabacteroides sp. PH5-
MKTKREGSSFQQMSSKRKLESVFLFVTGRCNAKCTMCFYANDMEMKEQDLTFEEIKKLSESAGEFNRLWLSGGEPTLREDLPEIIEMFYQNNHIKDVNMPTNGLKADRVIEWVKRIRKNCPDLNMTVSVSLDGFGNTHDTQRGVPGNFYKAVETLKKVDENFGDDGKVLKNIATVITRYNIEEIIDFMMWAYGRLNVLTHTIEAARGMTREDGVKILTEQSLRELQDKIVPFYAAYADRMAEGVTGFRKRVTRFFYLGLIRAMYNVRAGNIDKPTPWGMDCTAGETTLVIDYDGRFRSCELREPIGNVKDYNCDVQSIMYGDAMKKEVNEIGHGYTANCWCTHGCWIMSSIIFNPGKMVSKVYKGYRETKKLAKPLNMNENLLKDLEAKYNLDSEKLAQIGIL